MGILARLNAYATDDPDFNEGHPEDRFPLCERPGDRSSDLAAPTPRTAAGAAAHPLVLNPSRTHNPVARGPPE